MSACRVHYVFSDLDGTLFSPDHQLSALTKQTLKTLSVDKQVPLVVATGRIHYDVERIVNDLVCYIQGCQHLPDTPFPGAEIYLITSNGAVVHDALTGELVCEACPSGALMEAMYRFAPPEAEAVNTGLYQHDRWFCKHDCQSANDECIVSGLRYELCADPPSLSRTVTTEEAATKTVLDGCFEGVTNICFNADNKAALTAFVTAFDARFGDCAAQYARTFSTHLCMDVMAPGVSKGAAAHIVLERLRGPRGETLAQARAASVAFGDGLNDKEMLTTVGRGFVMGNANPDLVAACPELEVIASNAEDGVARTLRHIFALDAAS